MHFTTQMLVLIALCLLPFIAASADVAAPSSSPEVSLVTPLHPQPGSTFQDAAHDDYQVMLFYRRAQRLPKPDMPNITLVAHATLDRLPAVSRWCKNLKGPMSISVYVRPIVDDVSMVMGAFVADACIARHADLHLVTERNHTYDANESATGKDMMTHYPFNVQRNAALDGCVGDLALLMDIDFHLMPLPNNREVDLRRHLNELRTKVTSWPFLADEPWVADAAMYVLPAVETINKNVTLPRTFSELRTAVDQHSVLTFYHTCQTCHRPTDLRRFLRTAATEPYLAQFEDGYEPYVIVNRSSATRHAPTFRLPRYDEVFVGRGWDKMSFFYELAVGQRRPFVVVPRYFLVHHGKGDMPEKLTEEYMRRQEVNRALMGRFKEQMDVKYQLGGGGATAVGDNNDSASESREDDDFENNKQPASPPQPLLTLEDLVKRQGEQQGAEEEVGAADQNAHRECSSRIAPGQASEASAASPPTSGIRTSATTTTTPTTTTVIVADDLLWRATKDIDWQQAIPTTLGFPVMCICNLRNHSAASSSENKEHPFSISEEDIRRVEQVIHKTCHRVADNKAAPSSSILDCAALWNVRGPTPALSALRRADWVFERAFHLALGDGMDVTEACNFDGLGMLVMAATADINDERTAPSSSTTSAAAVLLSSTSGCTLNRDVCATPADISNLLRRVCGRSWAPPPQGSNADIDDDEHDALGDACQALFERIHPLVRNDPRVQMSVALNAHHLIHRGIPRFRVPPTEEGDPSVEASTGRPLQATCAARWGPIAAFVPMPEQLSWQNTRE